VSALSPDDGLCLVLKFAAGSWPAARVQYDNVGVSGEFYTDDAGADWSMTVNDELRHYVYGTYFTPGPSQTATRQYVMSVRVTLRTGSDPASRVVTTAQTLNCPELLSRWWEADFDTDPTLDHNGDGNEDWILRSGGAFAPGSLKDGVWRANATLDTYPDSDFRKLTTAEVCFRNTSIGGNGAVFWINADRGGSTCAPILAFLQLQADTTQTLIVYHQADEATKVRLVTVPGLSDDFVTLRLLIDPALDTVNVKVDGVDYGTSLYNRITPAETQKFASIFEDGSHAEFDSVSVRVAE
jgi:hypothetical protein